MPAFVIVEVDILDQDQYKAYTKVSPATLKPFGGEFVIRGNPIEVLEGEWNHDRMVMLKFPDADSARNWYNSEAYQEARQIRSKASKAKFLLIEV